METYNQSKKNLIFKIYCNSESGLGHLIRCYRIASKIKKKFNIYFILDKKIQNKKISLKLKGIKTIFLYSSDDKFKNQNDDYLRFKIKIHNLKSNYIFIDDYRLGLHWHKKVTKIIKNIIIIDDLNNRKFFGKYYLNYKATNLVKLKEKVKKNCNKNIKLLLGPKYCILDENLRKTKSKHFNIIINFGNFFNFLNLKIFLKNLLNYQFCKKVKIFIFIGTFGKNYYYLNNSEYRNKFTLVKKSIFIEKYLNKCSLFIGSSGHSIYDMSYLNVPSIFFSETVNQKNDIQDLKKLGHYFYMNKKKYSNKEFIQFINKIILNYNEFKKLNLRKKIKLSKDGVNCILKEIKIS